MQNEAGGKGSATGVRCNQHFSQDAYTRLRWVSIAQHLEIADIVLEAGWQPAAGKAEI